MIPDKIYTFQDDGDRYWYKPEEWETPPLTRVEYIRKDALLEWAKKEMEEWSSESNTAQGVKMGLTLVIDKIESL